MSAERLGTRALNRATLERQLLLERSPIGALDAVEHLVGMQAQNPLDPYFGLWSRLEDFDPAALGELVESGAAARIGCMRSTLHLLSAADCRVIRPFTQPVMARTFKGSQFSKQLGGAEPEEVVERGRRLLESEPVGIAELGRRLAPDFPGADAQSLGNTVGFLLPTVQVPPRGVWGKTKAATLIPAETFLGVKLESKPDAEAIVRRYMAAYGPASVKDVQAWCGVTRLREVTGQMEDLRHFTSEAGAELLDLPDAPLPDPETPAAPRFLPEYDNVLLGYDDRSRISARNRMHVASPSIGYRGFLLDGFFAGFWKIERDGGGATLLIEPLAAGMPKREREELSAEGERLLVFAAGDVDRREIRVLSPAG